MVRGTLTVRVVCPFNNTIPLPQTWLPWPVFWLLPCRFADWEDYQTWCSVLCPRAGPRVNVADRETMVAASYLPV